jgi:hypothetical protein
MMELDEFGTVQLFAAEEMVRGTLLNRKAESMAGGSCALVSPCRSGSDLPFAVLTCDRRAGERIHREDIAQSSGLTKSAPSDWATITPGDHRSWRRV